MSSSAVGLQATAIRRPYESLIGRCMRSSASARTSRAHGRDLVSCHAACGGAAAPGGVGRRAVRPLPHDARYGAVARLGRFSMRRRLSEHVCAMRSSTVASISRRAPAYAVIRSSARRSPHEAMRREEISCTKLRARRETCFALGSPERIERRDRRTLHQQNQLDGAAGRSAMQCGLDREGRPRVPGSGSAAPVLRRSRTDERNRTTA